MCKRSFCLVLLLTAAPALAGAEPTCELTDRVALMKKAGGGSRLARLAPGVRVTILNPGETWTKVQVGSATGFVKSRWFNDVCKPIDAPATSASAADAQPSGNDDEPAAESEAAAEPEPASTVGHAAEPGDAGPIAAAEEPAVAGEPVAELVAEPAPEPEPPAALEPATAGEPASAANEPASSSSTDADAFGDTYKIKVALMDLESTAMTPELVSSLSSTIAETLDEIGPFRAIATQDVRQLLQHRAQAQALGCDDPRCLSELGDALGADFIVTGSLSRVEGTVVIQLTLMNSRSAKVENRVSRDEGGGGAALFDAVRGAAKLLVRPVLGQHSGRLALDVTEEGATVAVNGSIVGVSPMTGALTLAGGSHQIDVEKQGFIHFRKDIMITEDRETQLQASLRPSAEYIREYDAQAWRYRVAAWATLAAGVAGIGTGIGLTVAGREQAAALNDQVALYNAAGTRTTAEFDQIEQRENDLAVMDAFTLVAYLAGTAALVTGGLLWFMGPDPGKYDTFVDESPEVEVGLLPAPGGIVGQVRF